MDNTATLTEEFLNTHTRVNPIECTAGERVMIVFYHDVEDSQRINPGEPEEATFVAFARNPEPRVTFASRDSSSDMLFGWESYMYDGDWAYGSSAERFDVFRKRGE